MAYTEAEQQYRDDLAGSSWHSYPKIYNVGHAEVRNITRHVLYVQEKVDGSQFSFGVFDGKLHVRSKGREIPLDEGEITDGNFKAAIDTVTALWASNLLQPEMTYRGEVLSKPKHNALEYNRVPEGNVVLFDASPSFEAYLTYEELQAAAAALDLEVVPLLFTGLVDKGNFDALLKNESFLGGPSIEGIVLKPVEPLYGRDAKRLMAKFVSPEFKEVHQKEWGAKANPKATALEILWEMFATERRWEKAVEHLRDEGLLQDAPQDIGPLIMEVKRDVWEEEAKLIAETLLDTFEHDFTRGLTRGLPDWYKMRLAQAVLGEARE